MIPATRTYKPEGVSVAHIDTSDRAQAELWQWWIWAKGSDKYPDGLSLADKLPMHRALRAWDIYEKHAPEMKRLDAALSMDCHS